MKRGNPRAKNTKQETKVTTYKSAYVPFKKAQCHSAENLVFTYGKGGVYAGGWSRGAKAAGYNVIDLTAAEYRRQGAGSSVVARNTSANSAFAGALDNATPKAWLDLYIQDYGIPYDLDAEFWSNLADDVRNLLDNGENVLVCCTGGHGRTGLVVSILLGLIRPDLIGSCPIQTVRDIYCENCVETREQAEYVYLNLGLPYSDLTFNALNLFASYRNWDYTQQRINEIWDGARESERKATDDVEPTTETIEVDGEKQEIRRWDWGNGEYTIEYEDGTYDHVFDGDTGLELEDSLTQEYHAIMRGDVASTVCKSCEGMTMIVENGEAVLCPECDGFGLELTKVC